MLPSRLDQLRLLQEKNDLQAVLFLDLPNIRYLCGFIGSDGALVAGRDRRFFLTDSRYATQSRQQVEADEIREYRAKIEGIAECLGQIGASRIGFEAEKVSWDLLNQLKEKGPAGAEWVPLKEDIHALRVLKDASEAEVMEEAARLNEAALREVLPRIRPGVTEREIALELEFALKRMGAEEKAFDFIVASGIRGAMPHGVASEKAIAAGELVTIDFGVRLRGYHSDETVTFGVGVVAPELRRIFDAVLQAHDLAIEQVRPGRSLREIDYAARDHIAKCGYGEYFGHGLGHGVGLEVHEFPIVSQRSAETARESMVFTIEPGIYVPDLGGVRIEDMVMVTSSGCRKLTRIPKEFRTLPV